MGGQHLQLSICLQVGLITGLAWNPSAGLMAGGLVTGTWLNVRGLLIQPVGNNLLYYASFVAQIIVSSCVTQRSEKPTEQKPAVHHLQRSPSPDEMEIERL